MARIHPQSASLAGPLAPKAQIHRGARLSVRSGLGRRNRRVPRAPLPDGGITHARAVSWTASGDVILYAANNGTSSNVWNL